MITLPLLAALSGTASIEDRPVDPAVESAVMRTLDDYMTAFNRMDMAAWEATFTPACKRPRTSARHSASHSAWGRRMIIQCFAL